MDSIRAHTRAYGRYDRELDFMLDKTMKMFELLSQTPILLSLLVVALDTSHNKDGAREPLPLDQFDLYHRAVSKLLLQRFSQDETLTADGTDMLRLIACASHARGVHSAENVRAFEDHLVSAALGGSERGKRLSALWTQLLHEADSVPLVKILSMPGTHVHCTCALCMCTCPSSRSSRCQASDQL